MLKAERLERVYVIFVYQKGRKPHVCSSAFVHFFQASQKTEEMKKENPDCTYEVRSLKLES